MGELHSRMLWVCVLVGLAAAVAPRPNPVLSSSDAVNPDKWLLKFLVAVQEPWAEDNCINTTRTVTDYIRVNGSLDIQVGGCDQGAFEIALKPSDPYPRCESADMPCVLVTFHSSVIMDASPPSCAFNFNASYGPPTTPGSSEGILPGCFTMESREGFHMTSYWFYILSWTISD
eukprot:c25544_g1_i1.p1 GENE.c25544_g1_i1~~c25544_g1_i1.p1  ORF type:complete len:174 (+),score=28.87 c25544_g1_i1:1-522(+)